MNILGTTMELGRKQKSKITKLLCRRTSDEYINMWPQPWSLSRNRSEEKKTERVREREREKEREGEKERD